MYESTHHFSPVRLSPLALSAWLALGLVGCGSAGRSGVFDTRHREMGMITVEPFQVYTSAVIGLPSQQSGIATKLTDAVRRELLIENRLQLNTRMHSLRMIGMVLNYKDQILDVQAELYNGADLVTYIRINRPIKPDGDWEDAMALVAGQLLDQLMSRLCAERGGEYPALCTMVAEAPSVAVTPIPIAEPCDYSGTCPPPPVYFDYGGDWGRWRRHHGEKEHGEGKHDKPRWVVGAIIKSLPRSISSGISSTGATQSSPSYTPPTYSSPGSSWSSSGSSSGSHSSSAYSPPQTHQSSGGSSSSSSGGSSYGSGNHSSHSSSSSSGGSSIIRSVPGSNRDKHD